MVGGRESAFGLEVVLQGLHNILQEHAHNLTSVSFGMVLTKPDGVQMGKCHYAEIKQRLTIFAFLHSECNKWISEKYFKTSNTKMGEKYIKI